MLLFHGPGARHLPTAAARALTPTPGRSIVSEQVHLNLRGVDVGAGIDAEGGENAGEDLRGGALAVLGEGLREGDDARRGEGGGCQFGARVPLLLLQRGARPRAVPPARGR